MSTSVSRKKFILDIIRETKSERNDVIQFIVGKIQSIASYQISQDVAAYNIAVRHFAAVIDDMVNQARRSRDTLEETEKRVGSGFRQSIQYAPHNISDEKSPAEYNKSDIPMGITVDISIEKLLSARDITTLCKKLNPSSNHIVHYLTLDTACCAEITENNTKFKWIINWGAPVYQLGYVNLCNALGRIVAMRLGQSRFCNMWPADVDRLLTSHIYVDIEEMNDQAAIHPSGAKYHFVQKIGPLYDDQYGDTVRMSSFTQNRGWFRFNSPHYPISSLTMTFNDIIGGSLIPIRTAGHSFSAHQNVNTTDITIYGNVSDGLLINPADYKYLPIQYLDSSTGVYITTGPGTITQPLVFSGFTTADPITDASLISTYNTSYVINKVGDNAGMGYFQPPINSTLLDSGTYGATPVPVTITTTNLPRWIATLEFVTERVDQTGY